MPAERALVGRRIYGKRVQLYHILTVRRSHFARKTGVLSLYYESVEGQRSYVTEVLAMAGFGRFKLTDALPDQPAGIRDLDSGSGLPGTSPGGKGKGKARRKANYHATRASFRNWLVRTPNQAFVIEWSTSDAAISKPAASAPPENEPS